MVARFTIDSASSFLFGQNVRSLDAGLPYPYNVSTDTSKSPAAAHPSSAFATAFQEAQTITALRSRFGEHWPLSEFWVDRLEKPMSIVRGFLDPILEEAVAKKRAAGMQENNKKMNELGDRQVEEGWASRCWIIWLIIQMVRAFSVSLCVQRFNDARNERSYYPRG
jgi:hypothetical protein